MTILEIIMAVLLPPVAVLMRRGLGGEFLLSIVLSIVGWLPGVVYALYVLTQPA